MPTDVESISFTDLIRGKITVPLNTIDDFVVRRSDGTPIYNFAWWLMTLDMQITHVIGEDHISNTIKQILSVSSACLATSSIRSPATYRQCCRSSF